MAATWLAMLLLPGLGACGARTDSDASPSAAVGGDAAESSAVVGGSSNDCVCSQAAGATLSLACYCATFGCPKYDDEPLSRKCITSAERQEGCGQIIIRVNDSFERWTHIYDAKTHALVGVSEWSDEAGLGAPCRAHAGLADSCHEGVVCSICEQADQTCLPAQ